MRRAFRSLTLVLALLAAGAVLSFRPVYEPDLGWHLAQGREDLAGRLVRTNVFSFTYPDYRQHYTSWLFDSSAYAAWRAGGDGAIQTLQALILAATFGAVYLACRVRGAALPSAAILVLGFLVIEPRAIPRPHLVSFAGIAACAWLIERAAASRTASPLLWAVPLVAVWSNAHGESIFGVLMVGLFAVAALVRPSALTRSEAVRALAISMGCASALLMNPYGWGLLRYLFENVSVPQMLGIAELQPAYLPAYRAFFVYLAVAAVLLLLEPRRLTPWEALSAVIFGWLGVRYLRFTPLLFLATAPMLAARLTSWTSRGIDGRAVVVTALAAAVFISRIPVSTLVTGLRPGSVHPATVFSPGAEQFVRDQGLSGPLFNSNNLGGWLAWTLYPAVLVFQDSRLQAYPPERFRRILDASRSQAAWDDLVRGVDWAMLSRARENQLSGAGRFQPGVWATVYWDEAVTIAVRRAGQFGSLATAREYTLLTPDSELYDLVPVLSSPDADRVRAEARRNRAENPEGFTAAAVLCLAGDEAACADAEQLGTSWPALDDDLALMRVLRKQ